MAAVYARSDQPAMPQLNGVVGSVIPVMDSVLFPAGWTQVFSASNIRVYRSSTVNNGVGCYLRVDDSGSGTGGAREFSVETFANMTDVNTGTFGTGPVWFRKSSTLDATARPWLAVADQYTLRAFHAWDLGDTVTGSTITNSSTIHAGQMDCPDVLNAFRYGVFGRSLQNTPNNADNFGMLMGNLNSILVPTGNSFRCLSPVDGSAIVPHVYGNFVISSEPGGNAGTLRADYNWTPHKPLNNLWIGSSTQESLFYRLRSVAVPLFNLIGSHNHGEVINENYVACFVRGSDTGDQLVSALCVYIGDV